MTRRPASFLGSSLFSGLSTVILLLAATVVLGGGLFLASDALANRTQSAAAPQAKIGPAYEAKRSGPVVVARADPAPGPADRPALLVERMGATPKPAGAPPPVEAVVTPAATQALVQAGPERADAAGGRTSPGSAGCTRYKTYDPATQTYRAFDGTTRRCLSADRRP
jgi:hypothetical protein